MCRFAAIDPAEWPSRSLAERWTPASRRPGPKWTALTGTLVPVLYRQRDAAVEHFTAWATANGLLPTDEPLQRWRERLRVLLLNRETELGLHDPTRWRSGEIHRLFMETVVPRQVDAWGLAEHGLDTVEQFLRFLDETDRLHPASTKVATLSKELYRLRPKYQVAMADRTKWRLAKTVMTAVFEDGLTVESPMAELDAWAERFTALDAEARRPVLGHLYGEHPEYGTGQILINDDGGVAILAPDAPRHKHLVWPGALCDCGCTVELPADKVQDPANLAKAVHAEGSTVLRQLERLLAWVGDEGRPVDARGRLTRADRASATDEVGLPTDATLDEPPAMARLWRLALEYSIVEPRRTRLTRGLGADLLERAVDGTAEPATAVALWCRIATDLLDADTVPNLGQDGLIRSWLGQWTPHLLRELAAMPDDGASTDLEELVQAVVVSRISRVPRQEREMFTSLAAIAMYNALGALVQHGAAVVEGAPPADRARTISAAMIGSAPWAVPPEPGLTVRLTDLGRYWVATGM